MQYANLVWAIPKIERMFNPSPADDLVADGMIVTAGKAHLDWCKSVIEKQDISK